MNNAIAMRNHIYNEQLALYMSSKLVCIPLVVLQPLTVTQVSRGKRMLCISCSSHPPPTCPASFSSGTALHHSVLSAPVKVCRSGQCNALQHSLVNEFQSLALLFMKRGEKVTNKRSRMSLQNFPYIGSVLALYCLFDVSMV